MKNALNAKQMNTIPPTMVTVDKRAKNKSLLQNDCEKKLFKKILPVRTDIRVAIILPPITASPVHKACPKTPPTITPYTFSRAAKMIVVNCERSPHSAKKVIENAWSKTRNMIDLELFDFGLRDGVGDAVVITSA